VEYKNILTEIKEFPVFVGIKIIQLLKYIIQIGFQPETIFICELTGEKK
jgi:hypothetical protein